MYFILDGLFREQNFDMLAFVFAVSAICVYVIINYIFQAVRGDALEPWRLVGKLYCQPIFLSVCLYLYVLPVCPSICLSCLFLCLVCLSVCLCLFVCLSVLPVYLVCPSVCLSILSACLLLFQWQLFTLGSTVIVSACEYR